MTRVETLLSRLGSADRAEQRAACDEALERLAADPELRQGLVRLLRAGTPIARFSAAFVLFRAGDPRRLRMLPALLASLDLDDGDLRWESVNMLASLGRVEREVFPLLLHAAEQDESPRIRRMAIYGVRELGPERDESEALFVRALDDSDGDVRGAALSSLARLSDPGEETLDRVLAILERGDQPRLQRIASVLLPGLVAHHPDRSDEARRALTRASRGGDRFLERASSLALRRLDAGPG